MNYSIAVRRGECYRQWKRPGTAIARTRGQRPPGDRSSDGTPPARPGHAEGGRGGRGAAGGVGKEQVAVIYGEPETVRFLEAVRRLKQLKQRKDRQTKQAKQKVRAVLRKIRAS